MNFKLYYNVKKCSALDCMITNIRDLCANCALTVTEKNLAFV